MNRDIPKLAGRILAWSSALALLTLPASAQSPQSIKPTAAKYALDHHCAVPDGMVGEWVLDDMIMVRNGMPGPRISRTYGVQLSIACDGAYVEDANRCTPGGRSRHAANSDRAFAGGMHVHGRRFVGHDGGRASRASLPSAISSPCRAGRGQLRRRSRAFRHASAHGTQSVDPRTERQPGCAGTHPDHAVQ